jgi:serine/threonine-protein kinase
LNLTAVLVLMVIFGSITVWQWMRNAHRERMAEIKARAEHPPPALGPANEEFEKRLGHLEAIVTDVDFELNAKLNRLAAQTQMLALPKGNNMMPTSLSPGQRLADRFVVQRHLGAGGMGSVYLAHDERLDEAVALKIIHGVALLDPGARDRLRTEASAARRIAHPNVVRIHDIGEEAGFLFLSMEYVQGTSVRELIERHGRLSTERLRSILVAVLDGLEAAHAQGVIHRDLKPANVLVNGDRVKIIDFGLAHLPDLGGTTRTGIVVGTPEYMAPEQVMSRTYDARTDLYAVGASAYHALTGRPPFSGETPIAVSLAHKTETPARPMSVRADIPPEWDEWIMTALEKEPARRHASARAMLAAMPA